MRKSEIIILLIILLSFAVGIYLYPQLPDKMASHWNVKGEVDGYLPKFWGVFLTPFISLGMFLVFLLIPRIDPLRQNIDRFRKYFDTFIVLIVLFMSYIYVLTILWSFGFRFNMIQLMSPALAVLFYYSGVLIQNAKRNWSIGIRTPWTLSNEQVWEKTHRIGGKLFKAAGVISLLGIVFPGQAIFFILVPVVLFVGYTFVYSYFEYKRETAS